MTIPGVGPIIALLYKATVDNPYRFTRSNTLGVHLGLTPRKYASGEIDYDGHITKCGDRLMRTHLFEAAKVLLSRSGQWSSLKAWGLSIAKRSSMKKACVAVARKLAVLMHKMWVENTDFKYKTEDLATV
jgi:transposase